MDKEFVRLRKEAYEKRMQEKTDALISEIESFPYIKPSTRDKHLQALKRGRMSLEEVIGLQYFPTWCRIDASKDFPEHEEEIDIWIGKISRMLDDVALYHRDYLGYSDGPDGSVDRGMYFNRLLDSDPVHFEGDIIITDPCYIMREDSEYQGGKPHFNLTDEAQLAESLKWDAEHPSDWERCEMGNDMSVLGINTFMTRDTLYGDWSCTTFNKDTKEPIGEFCADAGLVSVFLLDEVLRYNPKFDYHINRTWTTTLIKDFKGDVRFIVTRQTGTYDDDSPYHKKGDTWEDFSLEIHGEGINMKTGEPLNFVTRQTGF